MDLLTVLAHEMGHVLGLDHQSTSDKLASVMQETLAAGLRREPQASDFDHILAEETNWLL
jgi:predicted Zn-dependent protease